MYIHTSLKRGLNAQIIKNLSCFQTKWLSQNFPTHNARSWGINMNPRAKRWFGLLFRRIVNPQMDLIEERISWKILPICVICVFCRVSIYSVLCFVVVFGFSQSKTGRREMEMMKWVFWTLLMKLFALGELKGNMGHHEEALGVTQ